MYEHHHLVNHHAGIHPLWWSKIVIKDLVSSKLSCILHDSLIGIFRSVTFRAWWLQNLKGGPVLNPGACSRGKFLKFEA